MAKKFVRGITDIKTINNQGFDTNNVNDLLSDGGNNYIHRRKADKTEEYHCLTDNIKTVKSSNNLLTVTNDNASNTSTLTVNHDPQKQDVITGDLGITVTGNKVSLTHTEGYKGDLNNLITTQIVKTTNGATNLPAGESIPDGILEVVRLGDIAKQTYTPFYTGHMYMRTGNNIGKSNQVWGEWYVIGTSQSQAIATLDEK